MESSVQMGKTLLAISVISVFVAWDIVKACKRRDKWIQGSGLTLTALSVQFLGYFDAQNVNRKSKEELKILVNNQLSIDSARLVLCTFLACVLPGVAFHSSGGRCSNIAALAVSLSLHMATEIYLLENVNDPAFRNGGRTMFISSSVLLLVAAISLVLYIGLAIINCKFTRDRLNHKIAKMVEGTVQSKILKGKLKSKMLVTNKFDAFKYWAIVRGCQQEFWLVSSAFSPAVLMVVTTCVAVVVAKAISRQSLLHNINNSVRWTLCFQCVFILTGWAIVIWRWAVFLLLYASRGELFNYSSYTMACGNRFFRLVYLLVGRAWNLNPLDYVSHCKRILTYVWKALRVLLLLIFLITMLPTGLFFLVIYLLVLFNFFCWWLSKLLARIFITPECINWIKDLVSDAEVDLNTEAKEILYVTQSSVDQTKSVMKDSSQKGENSKKIVEVIKNSVEKSRQEIRERLSPTGDIYSYIGVWKMVAVAAIYVLAELCGHSNEIVKDAVHAYKEAKDLLEFLDFPDNITMKPINLFSSGSSRAYQMSLEADIIVQKIEALVEKNSYPRPPLKVGEVAKVVKAFPKAGDSHFLLSDKFCRYWTPKSFVDEHNEGTKDLESASQDCVREAIFKKHHSTEREFVDGAVAVSCLGDIIACGVLELQEVLPQYCKKWAEEFKEENLIKALAIQEKFGAIKENWLSATVEDVENKLAEVTKVDVREIERNIGHEIIDVEAR
ncbi:hypothetical protein SUGI_0795660 [Cryptomeria japonica]|nr:hypothetical protein SUGI_0795660 [Cryptomeria japonica]